MTNFDINIIRNLEKQLVPNNADLDSAFTFYYDETNNIRKLHIKENKFNYPDFQSNFVIGGVAFDDLILDLEPLFDLLNLDSSIKEVKLKHLAKGNFLSCLKSQKLNFFLRFLLNSNIYVHYSSINLLYFSLVDIVDSALMNSKIATELSYEFSLFLKNDLYKLAKLELNSVVDLFHTFEYPNIKKDSVRNFIDALVGLFKKYEDTIEFHLGLTTLKQILKESKKVKSLPFIMDEEDFILVQDFSSFYSRPIRLFKNSTHIFDEEPSIKQILNQFVFKDGDKVLNSYSFEKSENNSYIQISDIFVGLVGKFSNFINTNSWLELKNSIQDLSYFQLETLDIYLDLVKKTNNKNVAFLHSVDSVEEMSKAILLYKMRKKFE